MQYQIFYAVTNIFLQYIKYFYTIINTFSPQVQQLLGLRPGPGGQGGCSGLLQGGGGERGAGRGGGGRPLGQ